MDISKHFFHDLGYSEFVISISDPIFIFHMQNNLAKSILLCDAQDDAHHKKYFFLVVLNLSPYITI